MKQVVIGSLAVAAILQYAACNQMIDPNALPPSPSLPSLSAAAGGETLSPSLTYSQQKAFVLPAGHTFLFPVMSAMYLESGEPLPWSYNLNELPDSTYHGKYMSGFSTDILAAFGFVLEDGPGYSSTVPPAGVRLIEYIGNQSGVGCISSLRNPATPPPPSFADAKAAADGFCQNTCGQGFEMTDFDMNQWQYTCYKYKPASVWKGYQISTWGGAVCEKVIDNGLIQACNPLTGVVQTRANLGQPATTCPDCDYDDDGTISAKDLTMARNQAYGPKQQGYGLSYPIVFDSRLRIDQSMGLSQHVVPTKKVAVDYMEVSRWNATTPVDCNNANSHLIFLKNITDSNPSDPALFGQGLANDFCQRFGFTMCAQNAIGYSIGHCRIAPDGSHSIRLLSGFCLKCL